MMKNSLFLRKLLQEAVEDDEETVIETITELVPLTSSTTTTASSLLNGTHVNHSPTASTLSTFEKNKQIFNSVAKKLPSNTNIYIHAHTHSHL